VIWELTNLGLFDHINRMITLSVITLIGFHCIRHLLGSDFIGPIAIHQYIKMIGVCYHLDKGIKYGLAQNDNFKPFFTVSSSLAYCYHSVNVIIFSLKLSHFHCINIIVITGVRHSGLHQIGFCIEIKKPRLPICNYSGHHLM
jgi:hypothetical protein